MFFKIFLMCYTIIGLNTIFCEKQQNSNATVHRMIIENNTKIESNMSLESCEENNVSYDKNVRLIEPIEEQSKESNKHEDDILSFGEYTDKIESERKVHVTTGKINNNDNNNNVGSNRILNENTMPKDDRNLKSELLVDDPSSKVEHKPKLRSNYNFASSSCGASVISHSRRAKHTSEMLIDNPDTYALFPCINNRSKPLWFIIQLCEPIRIHSIYLSNLELFSSYIKTFRVAITNQELLPNDSQWLPLESNFTMIDGLKYHLFSLENSKIASNLYTRYIRVEIIEHHNMDFFCPISVFKVFGISLVDELSGPSIDDNSPSYANMDEVLHNYDEPFVIDNLYDFYVYYHIDKAFYTIHQYAKRCCRLVHSLNVVLVKICGIVLRKSPTLNFMFNIFHSVLYHLIFLIKYLAFYMINIYAKIFGLDFHDKYMAYSYLSSNSTQVTGINPYTNNNETYYNSSIYTLFVCTFRLLRMPFGRDYCCTVKSVSNESVMMMHPDCSLCNSVRTYYPLSRYNHYIHSCFLDDFCVNFCHNHSYNTKLNTSVAVYNYVIHKEVHSVMNDSGYEVIQESLNQPSNIKVDTFVDKNKLDEINSNVNEINLDNSTFSPSHSTNSPNSMLPSNNSLKDNKTDQNSFDTLINETTNYSTNTSTVSNNVEQILNHQINSSHIQHGDHSNKTNGRDSLIIIDKPIDNSNTVSHENKQQHKEISQQSDHLKHSTNENEIDAPKLNDLINVRDENPLGYISRLKKNLTMTMKYLDEMSIKFKKAIDEIKRQISKVSDDTNIKVESTNHHYNELFALYSKHNATVMNLWIEVKKIKQNFIYKRGFYFNISLFDCFKLTIYICIASFFYKCVCLIFVRLLSVVYIYKKPRYMIDQLRHIYQKCFVDLMLYPWNEDNKNQCYHSCSPVIQPCKTCCGYFCNTSSELLPSDSHLCLSTNLLTNESNDSLNYNNAYNKNFTYFGTNIQPSTTIEQKNNLTNHVDQNSICKNASSLPHYPTMCSNCVGSSNRLVSEYNCDHPSSPIHKKNDVKDENLMSLPNDIYPPDVCTEYLQDHHTYFDTSRVTTSHNESRKLIKGNSI